MIIPENFPKNRVYLIGMPGSGKSFTGKLIAESLHRPFIDLDEEIARQNNASISSIFKTQGEVGFRKTESKILKTIPYPQNAIIATGGGTPCFNENIIFMLQSGTVIYLETELKLIIQRLLLSKNNRPLLDMQNDSTFANYIDQLFKTRVLFYQQAHWTWNIQKNKLTQNLHT